MDYRAQLHAIKYQLHSGEITYQEAKVKAKPLLDAMNKRGMEISKEHGMKYKPMTFAYVMR